MFPTLDESNGCCKHCSSLVVVVHHKMDDSQSTGNVASKFFIMNRPQHRIWCVTTRLVVVNDDVGEGWDTNIGASG
jgi:hypothetical protein